MGELDPDVAQALQSLFYFFLGFLGLCGCGVGFILIAAVILKVSAPHLDNGLTNFFDFLGRVFRGVFKHATLTDFYESVLYALTWMLEIPGALLRFVFFYLLALILILIATIFLAMFDMTVAGRGLLNPSTFRETSTQVLTINLLLLIVAFSFGNLIISGATALGFVPKGFDGSRLTRFSMGARVSSKREREKLVEAWKQIEENLSGDIQAPNQVFVLDNFLLSAHAVGTTLYVSKGLINSPHLAAVLAHNLGHLNSSDARLTLALRRFIMPPFFLFNQATASELVPGVMAVPSMAGQAFSEISQTSPMTFPNVNTAYFYGIIVYILLICLSIAGGGFGLLLLSPLWVWHFRKKDYQADMFAARRGMAQPLIDYLEEHQFFDAPIPYLLSVQPYTELRIDRLMAYLEREQGKESPPQEPQEESLEPIG